MGNFFEKVFDINKKESLATKLRRRRFDIFLSLLNNLTKPVRILDVGGTQTFWENMNFVEDKGISIVIFNKIELITKYKNFINVTGDARNMHMFKNNEFDIVFSNSTLQYVGTNGYSDQYKMAKEIRRIGKRYFIQTPNHNFPFEPHFLFPFFQFLPMELKIFLLSHFNLGWRKKTIDRNNAIRNINSIRLLKKNELIELFPNATLFEEKIFGLVKSFIVYNGF